MSNRPGVAPQLISTYPSAWTKHYLQSHYERFDPVIIQALGYPETFKWSLIYKSDRDDWVLAMVASRFGFGFFPEHSIIHDGIVARPLVIPEYWRNIHLVTVSDGPKSHAVGAMEAVTVCEKSGYRVTATVVDASGLVKAVAKGDLAPPHTLDSSHGKSYGAVSLGPNFGESTTSAVVGRVSSGPAFGPLQHLPGVFLVPGGVVIKSGEDVVGAIGVGGAPGGDKDEVCAQAAVAKIADRLR
ncbi:heme-binding protein [Bradyrhizobium sp. Ash2021]|nr:heme-binding protein [Bradyrhizobium sp. Ash2021]